MMPTTLVITLGDVLRFTVLGLFLLFALLVLLRAVVMLVWCKAFGHRHPSDEYPMARCARCGEWSAT